MAATVGVVEDSPEQKRQAYDAAVRLMQGRFVKTLLPESLTLRGVEAAPDGAPEALDGACKAAVRLEVVRAAPGNDGVGAAVTARADALGEGGGGVVVVLAKHARGAVAEFFMGSVCAHVTRRCKRATVCVTHGGDDAAAAAAGAAAGGHAGGKQA
jgi:hypothetical protein